MGPDGSVWQNTSITRSEISEVEISIQGYLPPLDWERPGVAIIRFRTYINTATGHEKPKISYTCLGEPELF